MFGIRVYDLQVKRGGTGRKPLDHADPLDDGVTTREHLVSAAADLGARGPIPAVPNSTAPSLFSPTVAAREGDPLTTFLLPGAESSAEHMPDVEQWDYSAGGSAHVLLKVEYGYVGAYENARDISSTISIRDRAATGIFRALFLLPSSGTHGRLIVETNGRTSPLVPILRLLAWSDYSAAVAKHGSGKGDPWIRYRAEQMADLARLKRMANNMEKVEVELSRKQPRRAGGNIGQAITLTVKVDEQQRRQAAIQNLLGWVDGGDPGEYVHVLEQIAGFDPDDLEAAGLTFNSGKLEIVDSAGQRKTLDPENIRARFTYPISEVQLDDVAWLSQVRTTVVSDLLAGSEVDW